MTTSNDIYSAMSGGKAYKTYKKQILGKLYVITLNMLTGTPTPEGVILEGDPRKNDPKCLFDVFSEQEDYFFKKMNKRHLDEGRLTEFQRTFEAKERKIDDFSDDELKTVISKPFKSLEAAINSTNSVATLWRILNLAREAEKSEKVIRHIESRLAEVQENSIPQTSNIIEEEL